MYISRYKSSTAKSIAGRVREISNKIETPGPGSYSTFSEFGYTESKYAKRYRESQEKNKMNSPQKTDRSERKEIREKLNTKSISSGFIKYNSPTKDYTKYLNEKEKENKNKNKENDIYNNDKNLNKYFDNIEEVNN
jgi:hypothetical protein